MLVRPDFRRCPPIKPQINLGALLDIPTGNYLTGLHGESILNGGLTFTTGIVGPPNYFKSKMLNYMLITGFGRTFSGCEDTWANSNDTEVSINETHLKHLMHRSKLFGGRDVIEEGFWMLTDPTVAPCEKWYDELKTGLYTRKKQAAKIERPTPFPAREPGERMMIIPPTFTGLDSFTKFITSDVMKIQDDNELGDSSGNTLYMRQGLIKSRLMFDLPVLTGGHSHYFLNTAHIGKEMTIATGPVPQAPAKRFQHLKGDQKVKGVPKDWEYLMMNCWHAYNARVLENDTTRGPEYPRDAQDNLPGDKDLNLVSICQLRGKAGQSGFSMDLVVSQADGLLPGLTEFHYLRTNKNYGMTGTLQHGLRLDLLPETRVQRTTVRGLLEEDPKLARAMTITAEIAQMYQFWRHLEPWELCSPAELYEDLKKQGYNWDELLATRGWWTLDNDKHPVPYLSTMDLLKMRSVYPESLRYRPYWMK
jgi:hypothetical protein